MKIDPRAKLLLRQVLLITSWAFWVAIPIVVLLPTWSLLDPTPVQRFGIIFASRLMYIGAAAWLVALVHAVRFKLIQKPIRLGWPILLAILGPLTTPFYVMKEIPKAQTKTEDAEAS